MNVLEYTAYGITGLKSESMLKKLIVNIKKSFHENAENKIGVRYMTIEKEKEVRAMLVAYFPKLKEERRVYEEIYREHMTKLIEAEVRKMDGGVLSFGRLPFIQIGKKTLPYKQYEFKRSKESERFVIENSNDLYNRFQARCARKIEKFFQKDKELEDVVVDFMFDEVQLFAMFPGHIVDAIHKNTTTLSEKPREAWLKQKQEEVSHRRVSYEIELIYIETKREIEQNIANSFKRRKGTTKVIIEMDERFKIDSYEIKDYLESDYYNRIRSVKEIKGKNPKILTYECDVVHPYTAHKTDNVKGIFNQYALDLVDSKIDEKVVELTEMYYKPKEEGQMITMHDITIRLKYKRK